MSSRILATGNSQKSLLQRRSNLILYTDYAGVLTIQNFCQMRHALSKCKR
jgi:hypothetical protein